MLMSASKYVSVPLLFQDKTSKEDEGELSTAFKTKPTKPVNAKSITKVFRLFYVRNTKYLYGYCMYLHAGGNREKSPKTDMSVVCQC